MIKDVVIHNRLLRIATRTFVCRPLGECLRKNLLGNQFGIGGCPRCWRRAISELLGGTRKNRARKCLRMRGMKWWTAWDSNPRSEEHTSELQSHVNLVCRL